MPRLKLSKPKIAIYSGEIPSTTFIERLIKGVADNGCQVYVFGSITKKTAYKSPNTHVVGYSQSKIDKAYHLLKFSLLLFLFKNKAKQTLDVFIKSHSKNTTLYKLKYYPVLWCQPDIFHIQWAKSIGDWMWLQQFGTKIIVSLRGAHINYSPITIPEVAHMYQDHFPKVNAFHAVSKAIALEAQKYGASNDNIHVIYSGLPSLELPLNKQKDTMLKIISVGRSHWVKAYNDAIDACYILKQLGITFEYKIIGGKNSEELQFQITDLQLIDHVELLSPLPYKEVQEHMMEADVLLVSSVTEGIANVVLEAMQLGTLVISTDCGGMAEVIDDGINGFLVPTRQPEKIAETLKNIVSLSREKKDMMIDVAKKAIANQHTSIIMMEGMIAMYEKVMKHP